MKIHLLSLGAAGLLAAACAPVDPGPMPMPPEDPVMTATGPSRLNKFIVNLELRGYSVRNLGRSYVIP